MSVFEKEITVTGFECDFRNCMKQSSLLRQTQQISREHNDALGMSLELHEKTNTAFLINDVSVSITHQLHAYDRVLLRTQPFAPYRAGFYRKTELYREGELCGCVDTHWMIVDTLERKILRDYPPELSAFFPQEQQPAPKHKIKKLPTAPIGACMAVYSMVDQNRHLNNAEYADLVCNCTPMDRPVSTLTLRYHRECRYHESMSLFVGQSEGLWYVMGQKAEGQKCFEANLWFA